MFWSRFNPRPLSRANFAKVYIEEKLRYFEEIGAMQNERDPYAMLNTIEAEMKKMK